MKSDLVPEDGPSAEQKRWALRSVLSSGLIKPGTQLYSLLAYLAEKSLQDQDENRPLKEYTIGLEVLHKPGDYDPRTDPTVRVSIGKLRKKLEAYYRGPGKEDAVRLEIPRGDYHVRFVNRQTESRPSYFRLRSAAYLLVILLLSGTLAVTVPTRGEAEDEGGMIPGALPAPELAALWGPFLNPRISTVIVYSTPLFLKMDSYFFRDPGLNRTEEFTQRPQLWDVKSALGVEHLRPAYDYTGVGSAEALFQLTRFLASQAVHLSVQPAYNAVWAGLRNKNIILLGSQESNPLLSELPYLCAFESQGRKLVRIRPRPGQENVFERVYKAPHGEVVEDFALVSVYPGLTSGTRLMILGSSLTQGTGAAAEFVTSPKALSSLFQNMGVSPGTDTLPEAFQVVLKLQLKQGIPVRLSYVTHEVLDL